MFYAKRPNRFVYCYNSATDDLGVLGFQRRFIGSSGNGINNLGQVVGLSTSANFSSFGDAFRTAPNSRINSATDNLSSLVNSPVNVPYFSSTALGINDSGQVVGAYSSNFTSPSFPLFGPLAFRTAANSPINLATDSLGTLGGSNSIGYAINNLGQVVGNATTGSGQTHAFRTAANSAINPATDDLGTLGGTSSTAYAINNLGQVVGSSATTSGDTHAFLYDDGSLLDLNNLIPAASGFVLSDARGINDLGQIVGDGVINGQTHAFLATPVPEPNSALYTLAFGVLTAGFVLKRRI